MNISYINKLLKDNSRLIIPGFGAFLLKTRPSGPSDEKTEKVHITFNDFLKFNDGVLVDHIAQKEKLNKFVFLWHVAAPCIE